MTNSHERRPDARYRTAVLAFIVSGVLFMLLPGTFLGVWNLLAISSRQGLQSVSGAWVQAHGHAQIYGWIGSFVIGIGFQSLSRSGRLPQSAAFRAWLSYALWTGGVALRWTAGVTGWHWRIAVPFSALLEIAGFLIFFASVSAHRSGPAVGREPTPVWMRVVIGSTFGFLLSLVVNVFAGFDIALRCAGPALPHLIDQRLLTLPVWAFLVPTVWGFNARWLPAFAGMRAADGRALLIALASSFAGVAFSALGLMMAAGIAFLTAVAIAISSLRVFEPDQTRTSAAAIDASFPAFIRLAYIWLFMAAVLTVWAAAADRSGGIWGALRHAVTVGFLASMVFSIGAKILPQFRGVRTVFSKGAATASLTLLNAGCALRVISEIPAYERFRNAAFFWRMLPVSAVLELAAVTIFAANLLATFYWPAPVSLPKERAFA